jgi:predicted transcriptional regulator
MPSKRKTPPLPSPAELDILAVLWRLGAATVRQVHDALHRKASYTTTLTQMRLMAGKGLLARSERFGAHVYEPGVPKEKTRQQIAADLLSRAFDGSAHELVLGALSAKPPTAEELEGIRRMIEQFGKEKGKSG